MNTIETIRAEIERRLKNIREYMNGIGMKYKGPKYHIARGKESAYDAILNILDTLPEQPVSEGLEEAAEKCEAYYDVGEEHGYLCTHRGDIKDAFIAGAEWMKAKMMEEAVEGEVCHLASVHYVKTNESQLFARLKQFKPGDKVRIIIVKEDE